MSRVRKAPGGQGASLWAVTSRLLGGCRGGAAGERYIDFMGHLDPCWDKIEPGPRPRNRS